ncbi:hypothetical protein ALQ01_200063 [Pseudomonas savastanoi pv. glycinea]|uniref:Uncharacterized protein n=1 Tax=Pseudomonas savastanoi pv. glycinea TaxID=318 RepID=A0A3M3FNT6_PSESG|nr:hypothetical protein ALQ73_200180 [Pseudomonas savastanoi pv. glycinea]RMQ56710.1 hypothetical protein ALQ01_200063 [Pseudomonas savastanoi pv. glycinea]
MENIFLCLSVITTGCIITLGLTSISEQLSRMKELRDKELSADSSAQESKES